MRVYICYVDIHRYFQCFNVTMYKSESMYTSHINKQFIYTERQPRAAVGWLSGS